MSIQRDAALRSLSLPLFFSGHELVALVRFVTLGSREDYFKRRQVPFYLLRGFCWLRLLYDIFFFLASLLYSRIAC